MERRPVAPGANRTAPSPPRTTVPTISCPSTRRQLRMWQLAGMDVEVGATHPAGVDAQQQLARGRAREARHPARAQRRARPLEHHRWWPRTAGAVSAASCSAAWPTSWCGWEMVPILVYRPAGRVKPRRRRGQAVRLRRHADAGDGVELRVSQRRHGADDGDDRVLKPVAVRRVRDRGERGPGDPLLRRRRALDARGRRRRIAPGLDELRRERPQARRGP